MNHRKSERTTVRLTCTCNAHGVWCCSTTDNAHTFCGTWYQPSTFWQRYRTAFFPYSQEAHRFVAMERRERNRLMSNKEREAENARNMEICRQQVTCLQTTSGGNGRNNKIAASYKYTEPNGHTSLLSVFRRVEDLYMMLTYASRKAEYLHT